MPVRWDAFISYGRADSKAFVTRLHDRLIAQKLNIWFDQNDIPLGVDFQNQIDDGIQRSHNFLFIISPHSVNSIYCRKEIDLALKFNKRIIPVMHVEAISRDTWQVRHPGGNDRDWEAYQAKGLHSSFPNMPAEIGKINWVYFREEQDNFKQAFAGLLSIFDRHQDYVEEHTDVLVHALKWEQHQQQAYYLLTGAKLHAAEAWLRHTFQDEQPPCIPTDLQCEYICESIKRANNQMTQVFLAYGDEDQGVMEKVRRSLVREGITVWSSQRDIQTGEAFEAAIQRGIEQADNLVYLLSSASLQSAYCQQELDYALQLHKRIIPLRIQEVDSTALSESLQSLQYIDLADNVDESDYLQDESQLLKILRREFPYYRTHKNLLVAALKWEQQQRNISILLRGYRLRQAEVWLKTAQQRSHHQPIPLQQTFIETSLRQPAPESLDVFIAYKPVDVGFARRLNNALQLQGKLTWFEQEGFDPDAAIEAETNQGIETSDNFLLVITPDSIADPECLRELAYAQKLNKRVIPILQRSLEIDLPKALDGLPLSDFTRAQGDFQTNFNALIRTLDTDREYVHAHTKWSQRSLEWQQKNCTEDLLLRGNELAIAQAWLEQSEQDNKQPFPTPLQKEWIKASQSLRDRQLRDTEVRRQRELKRARSLAIGSMVTGLIMVGLASFAIGQWRQVTHQRLDTLVMLTEVDLEAELAFDSLLRSLRIQQYLQHFSARLIKERHRQRLQEHSISQLRDALSRVIEFNRILGDIGEFSPDGKILATIGMQGRRVSLWNLAGEEMARLEHHNDRVENLQFSPDGQWLATGSDAGKIEFWGLPIPSAEFQNSPQPTKAYTGLEEVKDISFSPDGQFFAAIARDGLIYLWHLGTDEVLQFPYPRDLNTIQFSPDGQYIATTSTDRTIQLWNLQGQLIAKFVDHRGNVNALDFSPDGQYLVSASSDSIIRLWRDWSPGNGTIGGQTNMQTFNCISTDNCLTLIGHRDEVNAIRFTPDGQHLVSAGEDDTARLWNLQGQEIGHFRHKTDLGYISFTPDGRYIAIAAGDNTVSILHVPEDGWQPYWGHTADINAVQVSPDSTFVATASADTTVRLWDNRGRERVRFECHDDAVNDVSFSLDGHYLATASADHTACIWNLQTPAIQEMLQAGTLANPENVPLIITPEQQPPIVLQRHNEDINSVAFSPDSKTVATASWDRTIRLWNLQGESLQILSGHANDIQSVIFSLNGQYLATASDDHTARLWDISEEGIQQQETFEGHLDDVVGVAFSRDSQYLVTVSEDNKAKLWNLNAEKLREFKVGKGVTDVAFSPDQPWWVTTSADRTARLWNLEGEEIARFRHETRVNSVAFSPDGKYMITVTANNLARRWDLVDIQDTKRLIKQGCDWVKQFLLNDDWLSLGSYQQQGVEQDDRTFCQPYWKAY